MGKATYYNFDYSRNLSIKSETDSTDKGFIKIVCAEMKESESIYIYALTTQPLFENILLQGENLIFDSKYSL